MALLTAPFWTFALAAAALAPHDAPGWAAAGAAAALACLVLFVVRSGAGAPADRQLGPGPGPGSGPGLGLAVRVAVLMALGAPRAAWRLAFGRRGSMFLRVRRSAADPGLPQLATALHLTPGVQTVQVDADGLLLHVLDDDPAILNAVRALDAPGLRRAP